ncbi:MAG: hypothetical protein NTV49_05220 [Kiritimatiellaeota bacterium]|nr:hypothetical protein [Kiritimatiellota bacterium]
MQKFSKDWKPMNGAMQPLLPCGVPPLAALLDALRRERVPDATDPLRVGLFVQDTLASITLSDAPPGWIGLHALLNRPDTPAAVWRYILTHELLHSVVPPVVVNGKAIMHPPEFWAREQELAPERGAAWGWLWLNFHACLKKDTVRECVFVKPGWRRMMDGPRADMAQCRAVTADFVI